MTVQIFLAVNYRHELACVIDVWNLRYLQRELQHYNLEFFWQWWERARKESAKSEFKTH